ncbi:hypothetical protein ACFU44_10850 [Nocardia rhizosphaerihabitans]|uniref:hypothetical protein n=1 Tax=Nocardia rhizosphaerihabitans TaxID=1691570 RepID=UPI00366BE74C
MTQQDPMPSFAADVPDVRSLVEVLEAMAEAGWIKTATVHVDPFGDAADLDGEQR